MAHRFHALGLAGALAAGTMMSSPANAATPTTNTAVMPSTAAFAASRFEPLASDHHCRRRCGWRGDRRWRRDRVDAGDVLLGAVIIGGIAAILDADNRRDRDRDREYDREVVVIERDRAIEDDGVEDYRDDGQWSDEAYGAARASVGRTVPIARGSAFIPAPAPGERMATTTFAPASAGRVPAYPGGPIPGEDIPDHPPE